MKLNIEKSIATEPIVLKQFEHKDYIPPRKIITIGGMKCYAKGFLSVTGAAGGIGKSSLAIIEELSLVYGLDLLAHLPVDHLEFPPLKCGRQRVWTMCLEDDEEEHQRRVNAALKHYKLDPYYLQGWYFVTYKADSPVSVASIGRDGYIVSPQVDLIKELIEKNKIDVLNIDPFVNSHSVPENDNGSMNKVADIWRSIAQNKGAACNLTHHIRKVSGLNEVSSDDLRGAVSLVGAARLVRVIAAMSQAEAVDFGIDDERRRFYIWVNPGAKANIVPPANVRHWFHLESVDLANAEDEWESDSIGVIEYWQPPKEVSLATEDAHMAVYIAMGDQNDVFLLERCRVNTQAKEKQYGRLIAQVLKKNFDDPIDKRQINNLIKLWQSKGIIKSINIETQNRKEAACFVMDKPKKQVLSDD